MGAGGRGKAVVRHRHRARPPTFSNYIVFTLYMGVQTRRKKKLFSENEFFSLSFCSTRTSLLIAYSVRLTKKQSKNREPFRKKKHSHTQSTDDDSNGRRSFTDGHAAPKEKRNARIAPVKKRLFLFEIILFFFSPQKKFRLFFFPPTLKHWRARARVHPLLREVRRELYDTRTTQNASPPTPHCTRRLYYSQTTTRTIEQCDTHTRTHRVRRRRRPAAVATE